MAFASNISRLRRFASDGSLAVIVAAQDKMYPDGERPPTRNVKMISPRLWKTASPKPVAFARTQTQLSVSRSLWKVAIALVILCGPAHLSRARGRAAHKWRTNLNRFATNAG
jgi:hypothetical protein